MDEDGIYGRLLSIPHGTSCLYEACRVAAACAGAAGEGLRGSDHAAGLGEQHPARAEERVRRLHRTGARWGVCGTGGFAGRRKFKLGLRRYFLLRRPEDDVSLAGGGLAGGVTAHGEAGHERISDDDVAGKPAAVRLEELW